MTERAGEGETMPERAGESRRGREGGREKGRAQPKNRYVQEGERCERDQVIR
jgi:hypothetical protein